jgi:sulfite reductase alpha subunit-like flavoprotein
MRSIDGSFLPWTATLRSSLLQEYPLPDGSDPIPDNVLLDPKWLLDFADSDDTASTSSHVTSGSNGDTEELPDQALLNIPGGLTANVASNDRVTPTTHWQDVRHLKLDVEGSHPYVPGDVLTIYPKNFPTDVDQFIAIMDWTPIADQRIRFTPSSPSVSPTARLPVSTFTSSSTTTLRELLTNHLDIICIPRRSFFAKLAHYTSDEFHRDRLLEFTDPEYIDELFDYTTRPRRSILEVLQEFESVKIPWQRVCSIIPTLRGRQFSIASAMTEVPSSPGTDGMRTRIELLIAIVKYKTVIKRIRQGVATRYIASLTPSQQLTVTLSRGGLGVTQNELNRPVVMIGPGTGVAPMRALTQQRIHWRKQVPTQDTPTANDLLFFGCRNAESDYFFKDEWKAYIDDGVPLEVFAAFSRDQRQKVYVQDLVRQQSGKVYDAVVNKSGILYICGSSGKMPQAVREALIEGFQEHGELSREDAEAYLVALEKGGRYRQETW